jgi:hypothetical protein
MERLTPMALVLVLLGSTAAWACTTCRPAVQAGIFNEHFWGRFSLTVLPLAVALFVVLGVALLTGRGAKA